VSTRKSCASVSRTVCMSLTKSHAATELRAMNAETISAMTR
jgi:hypothetical protein